MSSRTSMTLRARTPGKGSERRSMKRTRRPYVRKPTKPTEPSFPYDTNGELRDSYRFRGEPYDEDEVEPGEPHNINSQKLLESGVAKPEHQNTYRGCRPLVDHGIIEVGYVRMPLNQYEEIYGGNFNKAHHYVRTHRIDHVGHIHKEGDDLLSRAIAVKACNLHNLRLEFSTNLSLFLGGKVSRATIFEQVKSTVFDLTVPEVEQLRVKLDSESNAIVDVDREEKDEAKDDKDGNGDGDATNEDMLFSSQFRPSYKQPSASFKQYVLEKGGLSLSDFEYNNEPVAGDSDYYPEPDQDIADVAERTPASSKGRVSRRHLVTPIGLPSQSPDPFTEHPDSDYYPEPDEDIADAAERTLAPSNGGISQECLVTSIGLSSQSPDPFAEHSDSEEEHPATYPEKHSLFPSTSLGQRKNDSDSDSDIAPQQENHSRGISRGSSARNSESVDKRVSFNNLLSDDVNERKTPRNSRARDLVAAMPPIQDLSASRNAPRRRSIRPQPAPIYPDFLPLATEIVQYDDVIDIEHLATWVHGKDAVAVMNITHVTYGDLLEAFAIIDLGVKIVGGMFICHVKDEENEKTNVQVKVKGLSQEVSNEYAEVENANAETPVRRGVRGQNGKGKEKQDKEVGSDSKSFGPEENLESNSKSGEGQDSEHADGDKPSKAASRTLDNTSVEATGTSSKSKYESWANQKLLTEVRRRRSDTGSRINLKRSRNKGIMIAALEENDRELARKASIANDTEAEHGGEEAEGGEEVAEHDDEEVSVALETFDKKRKRRSAPETQKKRAMMAD